MENSIFRMVSKQTTTLSLFGNPPASFLPSHLTTRIIIEEKTARRPLCEAN